MKGWWPDFLSPLTKFKSSYILLEMGDEVDIEMLVLVLCGVTTFLITVTIIFEGAKDYMLESASKFTKPVVLGLFKELTVLGFLSLVTFIISKLDVLDELSKMIFGTGPEREGYLEELLEKIHMSKSRRNHPPSPSAR